MIHPVKHPVLHEDASVSQELGIFFTVAPQRVALRDDEYRRREIGKALVARVTCNVGGQAYMYMYM